MLDPIKEYLSAPAGILLVLSYVLYIINIINNRKEDNKDKPAVVTWILLFGFDCINAVGMWTEGTLNGLAIGALVGTSLTLIASFFYGKPGWNVFDKICLALGSVALVVWVVSGNATTAIVFACIGILVATVPTLQSIRESPKRERKLPWAIDVIACSLSVIAIPEWDLNNAAQPITLLISVVMVVGLLVLSPKLETD